MTLASIAATSSVAHLYVHVPFCRTRCPYCDFPVSAHGVPDLSRWVGAIARELELRGGGELLAPSLETVLVGGGTPSRLGAQVMGELRGVLGSERFDRVEEWTGEANPEDLNRETLDGWLRAGVTRVNLGIQSLTPTALAWLGRSHSEAEAVSAARTVADAPAPTWGVDLLFGLPTAVDPDPMSSVRRVVALGAPHVSLYELVAEPGTPLGVAISEGREELPGDDQRVEQYLRIGAFLASEGYEAYELTAFALPGHESRHARAILGGSPYVGLGPGAGSAVGGWERRNVRDWQGYVSAVEEGREPSDLSKGVDPTRDGLAHLWSRLRLREGVSRSEFGPKALALTDRWEEVGLTHPDPERVRMTLEGWMRLDELVLRLVSEDAPGERAGRMERWNTEDE